MASAGHIVVLGLLRGKVVDNVEDMRLIGRCRTGTEQRLIALWVFTRTPNSNSAVGLYAMSRIQAKR